MSLLKSFNLISLLNSVNNSDNNGRNQVNDDNTNFDPLRTDSKGSSQFEKRIDLFNKSLHFEGDIRKWNNTIDHVTIKPQ